MAQSKQAVSVSEALALAKAQLESISFCIIGEISQLSYKPGYKGVYFSIKDENANLPCVIWMTKYQQLGFELQVGQLVELQGKFTIYAAKGSMQFNASSIALAGEGELRRRVALLLKRLENEGLTAKERKRSIPAYPQRIGLVTSPRGAAVHDVLRTLRRRWPVAHILFAGVPVEGAEAPLGLIRALHTLEDKQPEVILLVRGGGSYEDLMPFNDESLCRAIAACSVPVVTGIGHEPDTTIADCVADLRASTPTAAAEAVSPSREALLESFDQNFAKLNKSINTLLAWSDERLKSLATRPVFSDSEALLAAKFQALDAYSDRLLYALPNMLSKDDLHFEHLCSQIDQQMHRVLERKTQETTTLTARLNTAQDKLLASADAAFGVATGKLEALSPLAVIARGFGITFSEDGSVISKASMVHEGDSIHTRLQDATLVSVVTSRIENELE